MKKIFIPAVLIFLSGTSAFSQNVANDCKTLMETLERKLNEKITLVANAAKIETNHLLSLGEWMLELREHVNKNSFGLFSGKGSRAEICNADIADIFRNFFSSGNQYIFQPGTYPSLGACTGDFAPELNTPETIGRLKQIAFALRAIFPLSSSNALNESEKESYSAFYNYLYYDKNPDDPGITTFFYDHLDDIKKATGFDPDRGDQDSKIFAQSFILTFKRHLQYYFGMAEEQYTKVDAKHELSQIRSGGADAGYYRELLRGNLLSDLRLIATELSKLKDICAEINVDPLTGLIKRITNYNPPLTTAKPPEKPTGEDGKLKPGHGWVLLGILDANGKPYREYGGYPYVQLYKNENNQTKYTQTIRSSEYEQVPGGNYYAKISMVAHPQSRISVENDGEKRVVLRLGRLILDPRNFDGTEGLQKITVLGVVDQNESVEGAILTTTTVTGGAKGGDSLDLAPGRYAVKTTYGIEQIDIVTIESQKCTKLTISGTAKFTGPKERIRISRIVPNATKPVYVNVLENGQEIQLPPGTYVIERPDILYSYRQKMERGGSYTYKRP